MSDLAALERHYRALLAWYPPAHRRTYGEEMIGVLLAAAPAGKKRPSPMDAIDLMVGGLRTRLRLLRTAGDGPGASGSWRNTVAIFSLIVPIMLFLYLSHLIYVYIRLTGFARLLPSSQRLVYRGVWADVIIMAIAACAAIVAMIVYPVLKRRTSRLAAGLAMVTVIVPVALGVISLAYLDVAIPRFNGVALGLTLAVAMEIGAVFCSPGPRRGWQLRRVRNFTLIRRLLALLAVPAYPLLAYDWVDSAVFGGRRAGTLFIPTLVIALLVGLAMWHASRGADRGRTGVAP